MLFPGYQDIGLLALRIVLSVVFFFHGTSKIKKWQQLPGFMRFIGISETLGSIAVLAGFLTQIAAIGLAIIMIGAAYKKHFEWKVPFMGDGPGWEFDFTLLGVCIALILLGAGIYSIDSLAGLI